MIQKHIPAKFHGALQVMAAAGMALIIGINAAFAWEAKPVPPDLANQLSQAFLVCGAFLGGSVISGKSKDEDENEEGEA